MFRCSEGLDTVNTNIKLYKLYKRVELEFNSFGIIVTFGNYCSRIPPNLDLLNMG